MTQPPLKRRAMPAEDHVAKRSSTDVAADSAIVVDEVAVAEVSVDVIEVVPSAPTPVNDIPAAPIVNVAVETVPLAADEVTKAIISAGAVADIGGVAPAQGLVQRMVEPQPSLSEDQQVRLLVRNDDGLEHLYKRVAGDGAFDFSGIDNDTLITMHNMVHTAWSTGEFPDPGMGRRRIRSPIGDIDVELDPGDVRTGINREGLPWRRVMRWAYGSLPGTKGLDDEELDVYLGPDIHGAEWAFVVHQRKVSDDGFGGWDEDKIMLGFSSQAEARDAYLEHYPDVRIFGGITRILIDDLREAIADGSVGTGEAWDGPAAVEKARRPMPPNVHTTLETLRLCLKPGAARENA